MATYTDAQLQRLKDALASGKLRVRFEGREIEYRSVADLKAAISTVEIELGKVAGTSSSRQIRIWTQKGLSGGQTR